MKKIFVIGLAAFLSALAFAACASTPPPPKETQKAVVKGDAAEFVSEGVKVFKRYFRRYNPKVVNQTADSAVVTAKYGDYDVEAAFTAGATNTIELTSNVEPKSKIAQWLANLETKIEQAIK